MPSSVREIHISSESDSTYFLRVDWRGQGLGSGFQMLLTDGQDAWRGEGRNHTSNVKSGVWYLTSSKYLNYMIHYSPHSCSCSTVLRLSVCLCVQWVRRPWARRQRSWKCRRRSMFRTCNRHWQGQRAPSATALPWHHLHHTADPLLLWNTRKCRRTYRWDTKTHLRRVYAAHCCSWRLLWPLAAKLLWFCWSCFSVCEV